MAGEVAQCVPTKAPEAAGTLDGITRLGAAPHSAHVPSTLTAAVLGWEGGLGGRVCTSFISSFPQDNPMGSVMLLF